MNEPFSKRHGFYQPRNAEIKVRQDAPYELRGFVVQLAYNCGLRPSPLRELVCNVLRTRPDQSNWSEFPNIDGEVQTLLDTCEWFRVYDIVEKIAQHMSETPYSYDAEKFENEINEFCVDSGIGWKLVQAKLEARGSEVFEEATKNVITLLAAAGLETAQNEIHESLRDISRRPEPDVTGAIQHSMAALECVSRNICGKQNATLGEIISRHRDLVPRPLDEAVSKAWGYASEYARHTREGQIPTFEEAELVVGLSAIICTYLARKKI